MSQADGIQGPPNAQEEQYTVAFAFIFIKKNMKKEVALLGTWPLLLDWISYRYLISF
jgi:hypothetical protein